MPENAPASIRNLGRIVAITPQSTKPTVVPVLSCSDHHAASTYVCSLGVV
jgi:hypothetical protein